MVEKVIFTKLSEEKMTVVEMLVVRNGKICV